MPHKESKVRQPTISPIPELATVFGEEMPICAEAICLAIAEQLKLPGFGAGGLGEGLDFKRAEDFYLKRVANIAFGEAADGKGAVPDADDAEIELFKKSREHLSAAVFDYDRWSSVVSSELWPKVVYVLNRGGRFADFETAWKGQQLSREPGSIIASEEEWLQELVASEQLAAAPKGVMAFYAENVAKAKNSMTGASFSGIARWQPPSDLLGNELQAPAGAFNMVSYKEVGQGHSRTASGYWNLGVTPESLILISRSDADRLSIKDGQELRVSSKDIPGRIDLGIGATAELTSKAKITEGIRPGVIAIANSYGHWAWGARDVVVDGKTVKGDSRRGKGMHPNLVVPFDPQVANVVTTELVAGNIATYDALVTLAKV